MIMDRFSLEGRVAIVTGGSRGIGRAIAIGFAEAGADVVVASRTPADLEKVAGEIRRQGGRALAVPTDIGSRADIDSLVKRTAGEFGAIDILVNGAYTMTAAPLLKLGEADWDRTMNTDLKGYYLASQAAGRVMVERGKGSIINIITGSLARACPPGGGAYMTAKAGISMLTKWLAVELGRYNVRVNAICPGVVKTDFSRPLWSTEEGLKAWESQVPLRRLAEPDELAGAAIFLASEASSYVTGTVITVDGGMQA